MSNLSTDLTDRLTRSEETGLDPGLLIPLLRLLVDGDLVTLDQLAAASGRPLDDVRRGLAAVPDTEYDDQGRIVGQGLTLRPTAHRFTVAGEELYTWCALRYVSRCLGHLGRFGSVGSGAGLDAAGRLVDPGLGRHDGRFRAPAGEPVGAVAPGGVQGGLAGAVMIAPAAVVDRGGRVEPDPGVPVMVVVVAGEVVHEGARVG